MSQVWVQVVLAFVTDMSFTGRVIPELTKIPEEVSVVFVLPMPMVDVRRKSNSNLNTLLLAPLIVGIATVVARTAPVITAGVAPMRTFIVYDGVAVLLRTPRPVNLNCRLICVKSSIGCHSTGWLLPLNSEASA